MDKNAIKKYAVWARRELIERVSQRAMFYGVTSQSIGDPKAAEVNGRLLSPVEKKQRQALIRNVKEKGFNQVMEEVAYTWFNRFAALRFMEVNGYLPSLVRVFTNEAGAFKPQILSEALHLDLDGLDKQKVLELESGNKSEELFRYLLIVQCNALNSILPGMFQKIEDYTELLLPDNLLRDGSVIEQMVSMIPEEDWTDQVQIIGWLYQYYNTEPKDKVFADLKKNIKISKENIPAATQLFTPDWIVHYMVENSLGRLWLEGHPNDALKSEWNYYLDEAEQEPEVQAQLDEIRKEYAALKPEEIRVIDPCCGSGHILVVMFDVFVQIYEDYGYTAREAASMILENNLWGLDIDERAAQLSYFAVMMKARQYDRRFFTRKVQPHVYAIHETNSLGGSYKLAMGDFLLSEEHQNTLNYLMDAFIDAKEYGSILQLESRDFTGLKAAWDSTGSQTADNFNLSLWYAAVAPELPHLIEQAIALSQTYHVVVTNPPYMGGTGMDAKLIEYVFANYPDSKYDLFSVCMDNFIQMTAHNGFAAMITMESWMFLASFERFRRTILDQHTIANLVHMPYLGKGGTSMGISFGTGAAVFAKRHITGYSSKFMCIRYYETDEEGIPFEFPTVNERYCSSKSDNYSIIPGSPVAYWASDSIYRDFQIGKPLELYAEPRQGVKTLDNDRFLKLWFEVPFDSIEFHAKNQSEATQSGKKWFPYNKGGEYRRWYGNNYYLVNWKNDGYEMKQFAISKYGSVTRTITNIAYFYKPGLTWSALTTAAFSIRWFDEGFIFDSKGSSMYFNDEDERVYVIGFMNSKVASYLLKILAPTLDFNVGPMKKLPIIMDRDKLLSIAPLVKENVTIAMTDWDLFENSWGFKRCMLLNGMGTIKEAYEKAIDECRNRFAMLRKNEECLNELFIEIYGLASELSPEIQDEEINLRMPTKNEAVRTLISFAVGCMFGRYSLDEDGLIYAGGLWNAERYHRFQPDKDGILPICDDEYFEDDIVGRFIKFIEVAYGRASLEDNLRFIADALGGKGSSREIIRNYFINSFYSDHCSMYSVVGGGKRPIYWLFDSGKKNGFKCLIYMHRYQPDTIARIRTDYVHEQQSRYRTAIADLEHRVAGASPSERVKLTKQLSKVRDQAEELRVYEEKIHHLADQMISIDLDDGVKVNYAKFQDVLAKIK